MSGADWVIRWATALAVLGDMPVGFSGTAVTVYRALAPGGGQLGAAGHLQTPRSCIGRIVHLSVGLSTSSARTTHRPHEPHGRVLRQALRISAPARLH